MILSDASNTLNSSYAKTNQSHCHRHYDYLLVLEIERGGLDVDN
jgi:hypothetical protein